MLVRLYRPYKFLFVSLFNKLGFLYNCKRTLALWLSFLFFFLFCIRYFSHDNIVIENYTEKYFLNCQSISGFVSFICVYICCFDEIVTNLMLRAYMTYSRKKKHWNLWNLCTIWRLVLWFGVGGSILVVILSCIIVYQFSFILLLVYNFVVYYVVCFSEYYVIIVCVSYK